MSTYAIETIGAYGYFIFMSIVIYYGYKNSEGWNK